MTILPTMTSGDVLSSVAQRIIIRLLCDKGKKVYDSVKV
jgi:hypothetical protein